MPEPAPKIDDRTAAHIAQQVKALLQTYAPEWKETYTDRDTKEIKTDRMAMALIACFARFAELVIERLNRVPEKNLLAFLDLLGAGPLPPQPARVPLTFFLAAGSTADAIVPGGTQVAAAAAEGETEAIIFETERDQVVTSLALACLYVRHPKEDKYSSAVRDGSELLKTAPGRRFRAYSGDQYIEHIVYLGHGSLLASQALQELKLNVKLDTKLEGAERRQLSWEIYHGKKWIEVQPKSDTTQGLAASGVITFSLTAPSIETTVGTWRSRWLRCRLTSVAPIEKSLPKIADLSFSGKLELPLDAAFADASSLDLTRDVYPFGERPQFGATFYLAQGEVFSRAGADAVLSFTLNKPGDYLDESILDPNALRDRVKPALTWEYWNGRAWSPLAVTDNTAALTKPGSNTLECKVPQDIKSTAVGGIENHWIRARIASGNYGRESGYAPFVGDSNVTGTIDGTYDKGAGTLGGKIESSVTGTSGTVSGTITGSMLSGTVTGTIIGTINGTVTDTKVTATITATTVGRVSGTITGAVQGTIAGNKVSGAIKATLIAYRYASTLVPPSIKSVSVSYKNPEQVKPEIVLAYNDFTYDEVTAAASFSPFRKSLDETPALYFGFVLPDGREAFPGAPLSLYFSIVEVDYGSKPDNESPPAAPRLAWEYWNNNRTWAAAAVEDGTRGLTRSGTVVWLPPADIMRRADFGLPHQHWLRVRLAGGDYEHYPELRRVLLNTGMAAQAVTVTSETLGSSDGSKDQRLRSNHAPILSGQRLEVRELERPTASECDAIIREEGNDAIPVLDQGIETTKEIWVRWHEVPDFHGSGARDRHYVLDHLRGEIRFGDGFTGMIPPRGIGNIRLARYQTGGGARGNQPAGAITQLKTTVPYVDRVINLEQASGGADAESLESLRERAPRTVRHGGRAVTWQDYEDLAMLASPKVVRAKCVPLWNPRKVLRDSERATLQQPGTVTVIILPRSHADKPVPSLELIARVQDYLDRHRLSALKLFVVGPQYVRVNVDAVVAPVSLEAASQVESATRDAVSRFLHPLTGAFNARGWAWGRRPHESDLFRCIESLPGVDHVSMLAVSEQPEIEGLTETDYFLVYSGTHTVRVEQGLIRGAGAHHAN